MAFRRTHATHPTEAVEASLQCVVSGEGQGYAAQDTRHGV